MKVISFCVYGDKDKYCRGLAENLVLIRDNLPDFHCFIYVGDRVPNHWIELYKSYSFVRLFFTGRVGHDNMVNRFYAIDEPDVDIAFVRDIDARVHERDIWCIRHFERSPFSFHTARDHPYHGIEILGGSWGIKRGCLPISIAELYRQYNPTGNTVDKIQHDQYFLRDKMYPLVVSKTIVYVFNDNMRRNAVEKIKRIPFDVINDDFCVLAITYDNHGNAIKEYKWEPEWNTPTFAIRVSTSTSLIDSSVDSYLKLPIISNFFKQVKQVQRPELNYHIYIDKSKMESHYEQIKQFLEDALMNAVVFSEQEFENNQKKYKYVGVIPLNDTDSIKQ